MPSKEEKELEKIIKSISVKKKKYSELVEKAKKLDLELEDLEERKEILSLKVEKTEIREIYKAYKKSNLTLEEFIEYLGGTNEK